MSFQVAIFNHWFSLWTLICFPATPAHIVTAIDCASAIDHAAIKFQTWLSHCLPPCLYCSQSGLSVTYWPPLISESNEVSFQMYFNVDLDTVMTIALYGSTFHASKRHVEHINLFILNSLYWGEKFIQIMITFSVSGRDKIGKHFVRLTDDTNYHINVVATKIPDQLRLSKKNQTYGSMCQMQWRGIPKRIFSFHSGSVNTVHILYVVKKRETYQSLRNQSPIQGWKLLYASSDSCRTWQAIRSAHYGHLIVPATKSKTFGNRSFCSAEPTVRNSLPNNLLDIDTGWGQFASGLKTWSFGCAYT